MALQHIEQHFLQDFKCLVQDQQKVLELVEITLFITYIVNNIN